MDNTLFEILKDVGNYIVFMPRRDYDRLCGYILATIAGHEVEPDERFVSGRVYNIIKNDILKKLEQRKKRIEKANLRKIEKYGY